MSYRIACELGKILQNFLFERKRIWEFGLTFDRVSLIGK